MKLFSLFLFISCINYRLQASEKPPIARPIPAWPTEDAYGNVLKKACPVCPKTPQVKKLPSRITHNMRSLERTKSFEKLVAYEQVKNTVRRNKAIVLRELIAIKTIKKDIQDIIQQEAIFFSTHSPKLKKKTIKKENKQKTIPQISTNKDICIIS